MTWILIALVLISMTAAVYFSFRGKGERIEPTAGIEPTPKFIPDLLNDKVIVVKGWNEAEIQKAIDDFVESYQGQSYPDYEIEPHKQAENLFRLTFAKDIHPKLFTFLVNYLAYPSVRSYDSVPR